MYITSFGFLSEYNAKSYQTKISGRIAFISLFSELRHGGEVENIELLGCVFSEHSEMLALPVFYLLGCQRRADSAAGFHPAVPALAREMHLQLPLLVVHELELFFVAGGDFYRVHRLARTAPVERLAAVDSLVFYIVF